MRVPFVPDSETSTLAADAIAPRAATLRERVLELIREAGTVGLTDEEIVVRSGLNPSTARPRRIELRERGLIAPSGAMRVTTSGRLATVWIDARLIAGTQLRLLP